MPLIGAEELLRNNLMWARLYRATGRLMRNFGDELSPLIVEELLGTRVKWAGPGNADLIAVGSILGLHLADGRGTAKVWGSGIREPSDVTNDGFQAGLAGRVLAVRGELSKAVLGLPSDTQTGDPGILAKMFVRQTLQSEIRPKLYIPHFRSWKHAEGLRQIRRAQSHGFEIVEPTRHPIDVINRIAQSDLVISSSLHGIVLAHALGTPVVPISMTGAKTSEPTFKYDDYYSVLSAQFRPISVDELLDRAPNALSQTQISREQSAAIETRCDLLSEQLQQQLRKHF